MSAKKLTKGDKVPHFELRDQDNRLFKMSEHLGKKVFIR